ncbi:MAG: helix-turn-helix domain-containing protein [Pirellulales bacterium]|nr:helix-turn-helix domain-containing protein [Pirellulales bacterium]
MEPPAPPAKKVTTPTNTKRAKQKPARRKTSDRFAVLNTFADFTLRDLSRAEIAVWLLLWRDTRDGTARTSQANLARRAGVNVSTVKRAVARLEKSGLVAVVFRGDLWHGPSRYALHPREQHETQTET